MKHLTFEPVRNWFGYSRRERRASFIMLLLIAGIAGARFIFPESKIKQEIIPIEQEALKKDTFHFRVNDAYVWHKVVLRPARQNRPVLDLNTCDSAALEGLPGIGPVLARRIIKYRKLLGGFVSAGQLSEVYGLTDSTFNIISGRVKADSSAVKKININKADYKNLIRLPYFEKNEVTAILKYRELEGKIHSIGELVKNNVISSDKAKKVRPYLEIED